MTSHPCLLQISCFSFLEVMNIRVLITLAFVGLIPGQLHAYSLLDDLTESQKNTVESGGQIVIEKEMPDKPWPRVIVYQRVKATPEEVAAVFLDYENAKSYIPDVLGSTISKSISPKISEVDYWVDVPILPDEHYTARNEISKPENNVYVISWKVIRALQTKDAEGHLRIEALPSGFSVIRYTNLVTPGSSMAKILRTPAIERMKKSVHSIVNHTEKQKSLHPTELAKQVAALQAAIDSN